MGEVVNVVVAFAVIVFVVRWLTTGSNDSPTAADALGFRPKNVSQDMIDTISNMFPDIPPDNIRYDLLRTGSIELTSNKILERGFLEAPPAAYFTLYPRNPPAALNPASRNSQTSSANSTALKPQQSLIERYGLQQRVTEEKADAESPPESDVGGKAVWEDSAEKREASLRERKAKMILAARQRMLAAQQQKQAPS